MLKKIITLSILLFGAQNVFDISAHATTLNEAINLLYKNNNQLKSEKYKVKEAKAGVASTFLSILPDIRYSQTLHQDVQQTYFDGKKISAPERDKKVFSLTNELSMGNVIVDPSRSTKVLESRKVGFRVNEQNIILKGISAYLSVIRDQAILDTTSENVNVLKKYTKLVERRFELGEVTKTDVKQSIVRLSSMQSNNIQAEGTLAVSKAMYARVFGATPNNLSAPNEFPKIPEDFQKFSEISRKNNLNIKQSELQKTIAKHDLAKSANALLPSVQSYVRIVEDDESLLLERPQGIRKTEQYEVTLKIPLIPRGGSEYARVLQSKFAFNGEHYNYANALLELEEQITSGWQELETNNANIEAAKTTLEYSKLTMDSVRREALYGSRTTLNVLDAELEYFNAKVNLIKAQHSQIISYYKLLSVMGKLDKNTFNS